MPKSLQKTLLPSVPRGVPRPAGSPADFPCSQLPHASASKALGHGGVLVHARMQTHTRMLLAVLHKHAEQLNSCMLQDTEPLGNTSGAIGTTFMCSPQPETSSAEEWDGALGSKRKMEEPSSFSSCHYTSVTSTRSSSGP